MAVNLTRVALPIEPRDLDGYPLPPRSIQVKVVGPVPVDAQISERNDGGAVVVFSTTLSGEYKVHLTHEGRDIKFSPLIVHVEPKKGEINTPPSPSLPSTKKTTVRFAVDAVDEKGNHIPPNEVVVVECKGAEQVEPEVTKAEGKILVKFDTNIRRGSFSVGILFQGKHIHRSPFEVSVSPSETDQRLEFDDVPIATLPSANRLIQFTVKAKTKALVNIDAKDCVGEVILGEDEIVQVNLENSGPDDILVSFAAFKPGKHKISVKKGGEEILGSPFKIEVPVDAIYGKS